MHLNPFVERDKKSNRKTKWEYVHPDALHWTNRPSWLQLLTRSHPLKGTFEQLNTMPWHFIEPVYLITPSVTMIAYNTGVQFLKTRQKIKGGRELSPNAKSENPQITDAPSKRFRIIYGWRKMAEKHYFGETKLLDSLWHCIVSWHQDATPQDGKHANLSNWTSSIHST